MADVKNLALTILIGALPSLLLAQDVGKGYVLSIESLYGSGGVVWAHNASGYDPDYGNPTSKLSFDNIQSSGVQARMAVALSDGNAVHYWLATGELQGGALRDQDWYSDAKADALGGPTLFSDTRSALGNTTFLNLGVAIQRPITKAPGHDIFWTLGGAYISETLEAYGVVLLADPYGDYGAPTGAYIAPAGTKALTQTTRLLSLRLGLGTNFDLSNRMQLQLALVGLPFINMIGEDIHHLRTDLGDPSVIQTANGMGYEASVAVAVAVYQSMSLLLRYQSSAITMLNGHATLFDNTDRASYPYPLRQFDWQRAQWGLGLQYRF